MVDGERTCIVAHGYGQAFFDCLARWVGRGYGEEVFGIFAVEIGEEVVFDGGELESEVACWDTVVVWLGWQFAGADDERAPVVFGADILHPAGETERLGQGIGDRRGCNRRAVAGGETAFYGDGLAVEVGVGGGVER